MNQRTRAQRERKAEMRHYRIYFAAYIFCYISKDGMVISEMLNISPYKLHQLTKMHEIEWINALYFWNPDKRCSPKIKGERYLEIVNASLVNKSLKKATKLWEKMFTPQTTT